MVHQWSFSLSLSLFSLLRAVWKLNVKQRGNEGEEERKRMAARYRGAASISIKIGGGEGRGLLVESV